MRGESPRESALMHLVVVAAVAAIWTGLSSTPLGASPRVPVANPEPAVPSLAAAAGPSADQDLPGKSRQPLAPTFRGERGAEDSTSGAVLEVLSVSATPAGPETAAAAPPPAPFEPWWTMNHARTQLWSGKDDQAVSFGSVAQWSRFKVLAPQDSSRLYVLYPVTGGQAFIDAGAVGPVPAPPLQLAAQAMEPAPAQPARPALPPLAGFKVGIQAGHWKNAELPSELAALRRSTGASGNGWREVDVALAMSNKVAEILRSMGAKVDRLPATVPPAYKADAFVSLHGDANANTKVSGYKLAHARWSQIPGREDALIRMISAEYAAASGLSEHPSTITENMRQYYAFNWKKFDHAVAPATPSVILELGFLTTPRDREIILGKQGQLAQGIAKGIQRFLLGP